jgi:hypothetical protein
MAAGDPTGSSAGLNNFLNTIDVHYNTAAAHVAGYAAGNSWSDAVSTYPTWNVNTVPTLLTLNGRVEFPDPNASIILTLTGLVGGAQLVITEEFTSGACPPGAANCYVISAGSGFQSFSFTNSNVQDVAAVAQETISITSVGRVIYQNNDTFVGVVPEPSSIFLVGSGYLGLFGVVRRKIGKNA